MHHATEYILERPKPLSLYVFTDKKDVAEHFIYNTSSGSICVNDTVVQVRIVESLLMGSKSQAHSSERPRLHSVCGFVLVLGSCKRSRWSLLAVPFSVFF